jgi:hypothetical protein
MMLVQSLGVLVCFAPLGANFFLLERSGDRKYSEYTYILFYKGDFADFCSFLGLAGGEVGFQIVRVAKVKTAGGMRAGLDHLFRERETFNADKDKSTQNSVLGEVTSSNEAILRFNACLPQKYRKDAVLGLEYLITASPEVLKEWDRQRQDAYFARAMDWVVGQHGKGNVIAASIHRDETSPHLSVFVVPKVGEGLNAKAFTGGKTVLAKMQDDFHQNIGEHFGLERGLRNSKARHQSIGKFYGLVNEASEVSELGKNAGEQAHEKNIQTAEKTIYPRVAQSTSFGFTAYSLPEVTIADHLDVQSYGLKVLERTKEAAFKHFSSLLEKEKQRVLQIEAKAKAYELLKTRKKEIDYQALANEQNEKNRAQREKVVFEQGRNTGFEDSKQAAIKIAQELHEAHGNIRVLNEYRGTLVNERDHLQKELVLEKVAHEKTKNLYQELIKSIAKALPNRLLEIQQWAIQKLGMKIAKEKNHKQVRDRGMGR